MCCAASLRRETYARERTRVSERERESAREGGGTRARENERDKERERDRGGKRSVCQGLLQNGVPRSSGGRRGGDGSFGLVAYVSPRCC